MTKRNLKISNKTKSKSWIAGSSPSDFLFRIFELLLLGFTAWLLFQQNKYVKAQNDYVEVQNKLLEQQNGMFQSQNILVETQNEHMANQSGMMQSQNSLIISQNRFVQRSNSLVEDQIKLSEADRISAQSGLMSDILDRIDDELKSTSNQQKTISEQLIGRIIGLSYSLKPYRNLEGDSLTKSYSSPERGQLFISIAYSGINDQSRHRIYSRSDFSYSRLIGADMRSLNLSGAKLSFSDFRNSCLSGSDLGMSNLDGVSFRGAQLLGVQMLGAILIGSDLSYSSLSGADLRGTVLWNADMTNCDLLNSFVSSKYWFEKLDGWKVKGVGKLKEKYMLVESTYEKQPCFQIKDKNESLEKH